MSRRESPSNRYLQRMCGFWRRPDVPLREGESHAAREDGVELHALAADEINGTDDAIGGETAIAMFVGLRPLLDELRARPGAVALAEVSYAYSPSKERSRRMGVGLSRAARDAALEGDEYAGTVDLVLLYPSAQAIEIFDHKTTWAGGEPQDATDQLATYLAIAMDAEDVVASGTATPIAVSTERPELGVPLAMDFGGSLKELDELRAELLADVSRALPNPGPHCSTRYCKARAACPATARAIEQVLPPEKLVRPYTPGQGCSPALLEKVVVARKLLEEAVSAMKADERACLLDHGEVIFSDGSVRYIQETSPEKALLDVPGALDVLRRFTAEGAIKQSVAWSDLEKLRGKAGADAIRKELRAIGATRTPNEPIRKPTSKKGKGRAKSLVQAFDEKVAETLAAADTMTNDVTTWPTPKDE